MRIIFLDGAPNVKVLNTIKIGKTIPHIITNDAGDEIKAIEDYNSAIKLAQKSSDQGTVDLLSKILKMEESHSDWAEKQRNQIEKMGLENYMANQS